MASLKKSSLKLSQNQDIENFVNAIAKDFVTKEVIQNHTGSLDNNAFFKISYGLFLLTARYETKDNGCIINTVQMITDNPKKISITVNKQNYTHDIINETKKFNISILTEKTEFDIFERFGFHSGKNTNKFETSEGFERSANGIVYLKENTNALLSCSVEETVDCGTHTLFIAKVDEAKTLSDEVSVTYDYYFKHIKPKPKTQEVKKTGYVCKICGYFYEGDTIPDDFICPLCKHGAADFEKV